MTRKALAARTIFMILMGMTYVVPLSSHADELALSGMAREYERAQRANEPAWAEWHYRNVLMYAERARVHDELVSSSCHQLALLRLDASDVGEAHSLIMRAYRARRDRLGPDHPEVGQTRRMLMTIEARRAEDRQARTALPAAPEITQVTVARH
jgi:hypothetical protein